MKVRDELEAPNLYDDGDVIRMSSFSVDEPRVFRVLGPMVPYASTWYKGIVIDSDTGDSVQVSRMVRRPLNYKTFGWKFSPCIFDKLEEVDLAIRKRLRAAGPGSDKIISVWSPRSMFAFAVLDREEDEDEPVIRVLEVGYSIYKQIKALQKKVDTKDKSKLLHGPIWCGDVVITKTEKGNKKGKSWQNIEYDVATERTNKLAGRIPTAMMGEDKESIAKRNTLFSKSLKLGIFTKEELVAIEAYDEGAFIERYRPNTNDEIMKLLENQPIAWDALDFDDNPIFPRPELYVDAVNKLELELTVSGYLEESTTGEGINEEEEDDLGLGGEGAEEEDNLGLGSTEDDDLGLGNEGNEGTEEEADDDLGLEDADMAFLNDDETEKEEKPVVKKKTAVRKKVAKKKTVTKKKIVVKKTAVKKKATKKTTKRGKR